MVRNKASDFFSFEYLKTQICLFKLYVIEKKVLFLQPKLNVNIWFLNLQFYPMR